MVVKYQVFWVYGCCASGLNLYSQYYFGALPLEFSFESVMSGWIVHMAMKTDVVLILGAVHL